jgi:hypothetical protein
VDNLLVALNNLKALLHHSQLIRVMAYGEDTYKHLQEARDGAGGGGGTTAVSSVKGRDSWSRRASTMSQWILGHYGVKWFMCDILIKLLMCYYLNHALNVWCRSTRSQRVGSDVPNLINNVLKDIKVHMIYECI